MEPQTDTEAPLYPAEQQRLDRSRREIAREGRIAGRIEGFRAGELRGKRDALLRFIARAGIALGDADRARIQACVDAALLDRWIDNAVVARTSADVLA